MTHHWDELSKSLVEESLPRRESLRRIGLLLAGGVLAPLGTAWAGRRTQDPCKAFCNQCPKSRRSQCLAACQACSNDPSRLAGKCGSYYCCPNGYSNCGGFCAEVSSDFYNCGACGNRCDDPGDFEFAACVDGQCEYWCAEGALSCNGICTDVMWDAENCGTCGNVCPDSAPYCDRGVCQAAGECNSPHLTWCPGVGCTDLSSDPYNCGACGHVCFGGDPFAYCIFGECHVYCEGC